MFFCEYLKCDFTIGKWERRNRHRYMKTYKILSKIIFILDINDIKVLTIFTVEYYTFFEFILKDWACIKCFSCFLGLFTFSASNSVESCGKSRRLKVFYFLNEFLVSSTSRNYRIDQANWLLALDKQCYGEKQVSIYNLFPNFWCLS